VGRWGGGAVGFTPCKRFNGQYTVRRGTDIGDEINPSYRWVESGHDQSSL
jgi:hypothetical protein